MVQFCINGRSKGTMKRAVIALLACLFATGTLLWVTPPGFSSETDPSADPPAAILLEPGEVPPPFVQLEPNKPPVPWVVDEIAEFHLVDQNGDPVTRETMLGEQWIANFIFTRCPFQCPATSRKIMELNQELRDVPVRFVTITVDPEHDTVPIMAEFASIWKATPPRWRFCTGKPEDVTKLIRTGFRVTAWENFGTARLPGMEFAHSDHLIHIGPDGRILGRYSGTVDAELVTLARVVKGEIETPKKHQPATIQQIAELEARKAEMLKQNALRAGGRNGVANPLANLPRWARALPTTNAMLNALAGLLLIQGYAAVKLGKFKAHKQLMLWAFLISVLFLVSYLSYHTALHYYTGTHGKQFEGTGVLRGIYFFVLITHVVLAAAVPVLAIITIRTGLKAYPEGRSLEELASLTHERKVHKRWAWITFPIWLYVSVTGVIIYVMLYRLPPG